MGIRQPGSMENFFLRASSSCHSFPGTLNPLDKLRIPPSFIGIPANFLDVEVPRFLYDDRLAKQSNRLRASQAWHKHT
jgi:hypothetical protein